MFRIKPHKEIRAYQERKREKEKEKEMCWEKQVLGPPKRRVKKRRLQTAFTDAHEKSREYFYQKRKQAAHLPPRVQQCFTILGHRRKHLFRTGYVFMYFSSSSENPLWFLLIWKSILISKWFFIDQFG